MGRNSRTALSLRWSPIVINWNLQFTTISDPVDVCEYVTRMRPIILLLEKSARLPTFTKDCSTKHPFYAPSTLFSASKKCLISCLVADQAVHIHFEILVCTCNILFNIALKYLRLAGVFVRATFRSIRQRAEVRLSNRWRRCYS